MSEYDVLSIIGCVSGCIGLLVSILVFLRDILKERHNLKIDFQKSNCIFFKKLPKLAQYDTNYQAILHIQLINRSSCPITVRYFDTYIGNEKIEFRSLPLSEIYLPTIEAKNVIAAIKIPDECTFSLPIRLESYDAREFIVFYPWFPDCNQKTLSGKVEIGTVKGKRRKKFKITYGPMY